jgi:surface antigen
VNTFSGNRLLALFAIVLSLALVFSTFPAVEAQAKTPQGKVMTNTQRMAGPSLKKKQDSWYKKGRVLTLDCYERGQAVKGWFSKSFKNGYDNLWYKVKNDGGHWVADVDIETGSNSPITKKCASAAKPSSTSVAARTDAFVKKYQGKAWDYDGAYGAQCVDLFSYFNRDVVKAPRVYGNAKDLYKNASSSKYQKLSPSSTPRKGDVAVWSGKKPYSGGYGHVAIVLSDVNKSTIKTLAQNIWIGGRTVTKASVVNDSKSYLVGYLRPKK